MTPIGQVVRSGCAPRVPLFHVPQDVDDHPLAVQLGQVQIVHKIGRDHADGCDIAIDVQDDHVIRDRVPLPVRFRARHVG